MGRQNRGFKKRRGKTAIVFPLLFVIKKYLYGLFNIGMVGLQKIPESLGV